MPEREKRPDVDVDVKVDRTDENPADERSADRIEEGVEDRVGKDSVEDEKA